MVATSSEPVDDELAETMMKNRVPFFSGSLHNTLNRTVSAVDKIEDHTFFSG